MEAENGGSSLKILEATMYMNHVTVNPSILLAHHTVLQSRKAIYPYKRVEVKTFTINPGNHSLAIDNVVIGQLPNLLVFAMVSNEAYSGTRNKNPFNFQHYNIQRFNLTVNGVQVPNQPLEFDFNSEKGIISTRGYNSLFKGTGIHYYDKGHQIKKELYDNGYFLLAFDLTADHANNALCSNFQNRGVIRIEGRFGDALKEAITCLVYCEYDAVVEIDYQRNIYTSL
jgi:hypothetical protein